MRRDFILPEEDTEFLDGLGKVWETVKEGSHRWLVINDYKIPVGYNVQVVTLALRIDNGYPSSQIDMVYFHPSLMRVDNRPIKALSNQPLKGNTFQRWSRHRTPQNQWRPGLDCVETHLMLVDYWLEREFIKDGVQV